MKLKLKIMNIFYFVISAAAIFFLLFNPLVKGNVKCHFDREVISETVEVGAFDDLGVTEDDLFEGNPEVDINLEFKVDIINVVTHIGINAEQYVKNFILCPGVDEVITDIQPVFEQIAKNGISALIRNVFEGQLEKLPGIGSDLYPKLAEHSITETQVKTSIGKIVDAVYEEDAMLSDVADVMSDEFNVYATALGGATQDADKMSLRIGAYFESFELIDNVEVIQPINSAIGAILKRCLGDPVNDTNGGGAAGSQIHGYANKLFAPMAKSNFSSNPLTNTLVDVIGRNFFKNNSFNAFNTFRILLIVGVLLALMFVAGWVIKILQFIFCLFRKTPYIRTEIYGVVMQVLQAIIALISLGSVVLFNINPATARAIPLFGSLMDLAPLGGSFQIVFSAMIPGFLVFANLILSIIYTPVKNRFKKEKKKDAESYLDIE